MRPTRRLALLGLLAAFGGAAAACQSFSGEEGLDIVAGIGEFLGHTNPSRHVERLSVLHDTATFRHVPDLPPTTESCLDEVRTLAKADYATWREVAVSTFYITRVASEDGSALNRGEAVRALVRLGGMVLEVEEPAAAPVSGDAASRALKTLRELHEAETNLHLSPEAVGECEAQVALLASYRGRAAPDALRPDVQYELRILRGMLMGLMVETRSRESHGEGALGAAVDRAAVNLASQAVRLSLASALRFDDQPTVRAAAAEAVEKLAARDMAGVLKAAFGREPSAAVRHRIVASAGSAAAADRLDREDAVIVLIAALADDDENVRFVARDALRRLVGEDLGPRRAPWVLWWGSAKSGAGK